MGKMSFSTFQFSNIPSFRLAMSPRSISFLMFLELHFLFWTPMKASILQVGHESNAFCLYYKMNERSEITLRNSGVPYSKSPGARQ
jgi:hypothetical protein